MTTTALSRSLYFFRRFLDNPREVGALLPSTRHLGAAMVADLQFRPGEVVVEYGVGTGSLTPTIAAKVRETPGASYLGIEREAGFVAILRERFPQLRFAEAAVENVRELLHQHDLGRPGAIVSGLPLILLPTMEQIVSTAAEVLRPGGSFRTFSYLQSFPLRSTRRLRGLLRAQFAEFSLRGPVWRNCPPAFVLCGRKSD